MQEILHRYGAIERRDAIGQVFQPVLDLADEVFSRERADVLGAGENVQSRASLPARDALHLAVMERYEAGSILSLDADFDRWPGLRRKQRI